MDQPYPCSRVSHVEMAQRWLLCVCISNWLCTIPLTPPPLPLPTSILSGCVCLCVFVSVCRVHVFQCTVSHCARTERPFTRVHDWFYFSVCFKVFTCTFVPLPTFSCTMSPSTQFYKIITVYCLKESL